MDKPTTTKKAALLAHGDVLFDSRGDEFNVIEVEINDPGTKVEVHADGDFGEYVFLFDLEKEITVLA